MQSQSPPTADKPDADPLLTPDEFRALAARIHRNSNLSAILFCGAVYSVPLGIIVGALGSIGVGWGLVIKCAVVYGLVAALTLSLFWAYVQKDRQEIERLVRFVTCTQDATMLGPLLDLKDAEMHAGDIYSYLNVAVDNAVLRLLPAVQATHAGTLNKTQRSCLLHYFISRQSIGSASGLNDNQYAQGVLHALAQIGDKHDLLEIEQHLNADYFTGEFRAAVQQCIDTIRERLAREEGKGFLLRADHKPEPVQSLLRPSIESMDTPPQQLLRAATSDEGNTSA